MLRQAPGSGSDLRSSTVSAVFVISEFESFYKLMSYQDQLKIPVLANSAMLGIGKLTAICYSRWQGKRLVRVIAHHSVRAREPTEWRQIKIKDLEDKADKRASKLNHQATGTKCRDPVQGSKALRQRRQGQVLTRG